MVVHICRLLEPVILRHHDYSFPGKLAQYINHYIIRFSKVPLCRMHFVARILIGASKCAKIPWRAAKPEPFENSVSTFIQTLTNKK